MTQEEKELLLKDLCARLSYGVVVQEPDYYEAPLTIATMSEVFYNGLEVKPYLRPLSSMTEEEREEFQEYIFDSNEIGEIVTLEASDWLNKNMFDYRGLIPMGLALEALEGMYK